MPIKTKRPMLTETVGALYYCFNTSAENGEFNPQTYNTDVIKSNIVKTISTTENGESTVVRASGEDYETVNQKQSIDMSVEVIAIDPSDLAKMRGDVVGTGGLNRSGRTASRPFFAFGKVRKMLGDKVEYAWYPKCQLVENTDEVSTKEENFSEQNLTVTIRAYSYNAEGDKKTYVNSDMENYPEGLTEDKFFSKPILTDADLTSVITPTVNGNNEVQGA